MRLQGIFLSLLLVSLSGCQCCGLFNRYADAIDCISDHEHHFERFYCPCWDLNRIGRPDWCSCRPNRILCRCACERCRPLPCEHAVYQETGFVLPENASQPDWSQQEPEPTDSLDVEPQILEGEVPPLPEEAEAEKDLLLP